MGESLGVIGARVPRSEQLRVRGHWAGPARARGRGAEPEEKAGGEGRSAALRFEGLGSRRQVPPGFL